MDTIDWRAQMHPDIRQSKVDEIMSKIYHPLGDEDELHEVQKIAQSVEHKTYAGATSQADYLLKISSMMRLIESKSRNTKVIGVGGLNCSLKAAKELLDTVRRHVPVSGPEGLHELRKIAARFEDKIYTAATSQSDYLRKISLKMLTMESKDQNNIANSMPSNSGDNRNGRSDPGSSEGERNPAVRQSARKRKQPQWLDEFVTHQWLYSSMANDSGKMFIMSML